MNEVLEQATNLLSSLSSCASLAVAPKANTAIRQIQFMPLEPRRVLVIIVMENGMVENRIMDVPENKFPRKPDRRVELPSTADWPENPSSDPKGGHR
ncbi:MAG: hypothetical protein IPO55_00265 [Alphaproteobacteria bacterium]|nr:hypothetical protein [Alphaproteobacteria bacterium]